MRRLLGCAQNLPEPRAVLIVSAHREHAPLFLGARRAHSAGLRLRRIPSRHRQARYNTPDASAPARRVAAMKPHDEPVHQHSSLWPSGWTGSPTNCASGTSAS
ncbi:hypothetical protein ACFCYH_37370 [Streptomyces sp. NPDC056400]|uniref:hypothetical protein n=1 Tax=unclassified Streptomyces TaxID=2593676 RepID=UPI0035DB2FEC